MADRSSMEANVICDQMGLASPVAPFTEPYLILESLPYDAAMIGQWQLAAQVSEPPASATTKGIFFVHPPPMYFRYHSLFLPPSQ